MKRDSNYFLRKADHFLKMSKCKISDLSKSLEGSEGSEILEESETLEESEILEPQILNLPKSSSNFRYYDPITKHYFRADKFFQKSAIPQNKLHDKIIYEPKTNKYHCVDKTHMGNGKYTYQYNRKHKKN